MSREVEELAAMTDYKSKAREIALSTRAVTIEVGSKTTEHVLGIFDEDAADVIEAALIAAHNAGLEEAAVAGEWLADANMEDGEATIQSSVLQFLVNKIRALKVKHDNAQQSRDGSGGEDY